MHPFDAASFLSTPVEAGSFEPRQQEEGELVGAASSSPSPSRGTRAGGENAGIGFQDCRHHRRAKAYRAHCCSDGGGGLLCPGHDVKTPPVPAYQQRSERHQQTPPLAASASTAAVDVEPIPKRPRRPALPSVDGAPTTASSVDQPIATAAAAAALERFAREVSLDAVFRRVRLRLGGPPEAPEVAYYTTVTIAGQVFRGVLYDVGRHSGSTGASDSDTDGSGEGEVGSSLSTAGGSCLDLTLGL